MKKSTVGIWLLAFVLAVLLIALSACATSKQPAVNPTPSASVSAEPEDCDLEDFLNREDDCGFEKEPGGKSTKKPAPAKTGTRRR